MPQMAPINWLFLFIIFCFTYYMFNMMNYFVYSPSIKITNKKLLKNYNFNWKW